MHQHFINTALYWLNIEAQKRRIKHASLCLTEPMWHVAASSRGVSVGSAPRRQNRQDVPGKDSPNRHSKVTNHSRYMCIYIYTKKYMYINLNHSSVLSQGETHYSSHSSSNTLSSNASSSHSDERWFDGLGGGVSGTLSDPLDPDPDPMGKGGSSDSGIDASLYTPSPNTKGGKPSRSHVGTPHKPLHGSATYSGLQELSGTGDGRRRESSPVIPASASQTKNYRTRTFPPPGSGNTDNLKPRYEVRFFSFFSDGSYLHVFQFVWISVCVFRAFTPQGYKTPAMADKLRPFKPSTATPSSSSTQLSSSAPKSFTKSKQSAWQQEESSTASSTTTTDTSK